MKKIFVLICFLFYVVNSFAVEKSKTFGGFTVYFDTEDVDKYYINPQKTALEMGLTIFNEVPAYFVEDYIKTGILDSELLKRGSEGGKHFLDCVKVIIYNNLAGGFIFAGEIIFIFKDSKGNLYYAH